ncbi:MAG: XRE family transcriptional regulator [Deltaproteobacteria bacterium]|nr:XRE family transcriptional regulator [Deltaproteobacteria bacterium]
MNAQHKNIGDSFDDFLESEGLIDEVELTALKRVLAFQVIELMKQQNLSKTDMAKRMATSRSSLERLLDPVNESVTLQTMKKAALVLGKRLRIELA